MASSTTEPGAGARLRVCYVAAPGHVGGLERVLQGQSTGLVRAGHEVHVIAVLDPAPVESPFCRALAEAGVVVHELRVPPGVRHFPAERRAVRDLLHALRPDIVHTHGFRPDILDAPLARALGIPTVTTIHGESFMGGRTAVYEWLQWRAYRRFDAVVAVSAKLERTALARGVPRARLHLVPNGFPGGVRYATREAARAELGLPAGVHVVGWLARMIPVKGADVLLRAFAQAGGTAGSAELCLIGDGSERPALERMVTELGLSARVRFAGTIDGGARLMPAFDGFVLSSRSEGTPIALFEAMAVGLPIVATRVGGVPDVLGEEDAWLVPPEEPAAMAAALRELRENAPLARRRGEAARARLEGEYGTERWIARHEALYRELLHRGGRRAPTSAAPPPPPSSPAARA